MTAEQRPVVDDLGNIAVHGRSGLVIVVKIETATAGVYENISASDLFFEIGGKLRLALSAGADIYSRQVILTRAQVATLSINQPYAFAIHDETTSTPSTPWAGTITTFGFKTAPTGVPDVDGEATNWTGATVVIQPGGGSPVVVVNYMGQPGAGIPNGGTAGQYLRKSSSTDYATGWDTLTADDVSGLSSTLSTLTSADVSLTTRLSTEETTRATADTSLTTRLSTEEVTRSSAVSTVTVATTSLTTRVSTEEATRSSADTSLATAAAATYLPLAGGTLTGALAAVAGTAALPGLAVAGDLNTGIYGVSADVLGVSAGGVGVQTWAPGIATVAGVVRPDADATRDLGTVSARWRDGFLSRGLYVGSGGASTLPNGAGGSFSPQIGIQAASGVVGLSAGLIDGVNNRRAGLFVNDTAGVWGLSHTYSAGASPFVMVIGGNEFLRLNTSGQLGIGENNPSYLLDAKVTSSGATVAGLRLNNNGTGANTRVSLAFQAAGTLYQSIIGGYGAASPEMQFNQLVGATGFWTWNSSGTEVMRLTGGGLLGLGVVPTSFLHIAGATGATLNTTYEPTGWLGLKHRVGVQYSGDTLVSSVNVRLTSLSAGTLDDPTQPGSALVLRNDGTLTLVDTTAGAGVRTFAPMFAVSGTGVATLYGNVLAAVDATYDWGASGSGRFRDGFLSRNLTVGGAITTAGEISLVSGSSNTRIANGGFFATTPNGTASYLRLLQSGICDFSITNTASTGVIVYSGATTHELRNGANAQAFRVYNTTDGTNLERVSLDWSANIAYLRTQKGGTGADRSIVISATASTYIGGGGTYQWQFSSDGNFYPNADATTDAGGAAKQIRDLYLSRRLMIGGAAPAGAAGLSAVQAFGQSYMLIGGDSVTDATTKNTRMGALHYLAAEKPVAMMLVGAASATNSLSIGGGTSSANAATQINFYTAANNITPTGTLRWAIDTNGHLVSGADNTYDIGASGASRPRNGFFGGTLTIGSHITMGTGSQISCAGAATLTSSTDGIWRMANNAGTDFGRLQFGGTTSAFPALRRTGTSVEAVLADNSAYTGFNADNITAATNRAITTGGIAGVGFKLSTTANFGVFFGSGAPTLAAAKGSLYLRSDGSGTSDRMYVNTDGATAWTAVTTAT